jgi:glycosyltransferase involved in cell wall biosynthesis
VIADSKASDQHEGSLISIVIPAFNEEEAIGETLNDLESTLKSSRHTYEVIVVDDGSGDNTGGEVMKTSARLIRHPRNRGYGASLKTGTVAARGEIVVFYDADNQFEASDIDRIVDELGDSDAVLGNRQTGS